MALVSVLWGIALLSIIALTLVSTSNVSYRLARNTSEITQTEAIAEAAINRAVLALLDPRNDKRWRVDGVEQEFDFGGFRLRVQVQDEMGRIDLNQADGPLLVGLFQSAGLDHEAANALVDKILDWRDSRAARRLNGATGQDYRLAGRSYRPRSGPFQSVDELKLVMDMTPDVFQRVEPALTVYSGRQFIDPQVAPREALLALPTMNETSVASLLAARTQSNVAGPVGVNLPGPSLEGRAFSIRMEIQKPSGPLVRQAVIRLTGDPVRPYWVLSWKDK